MASPCRVAVVQDEVAADLASGLALTAKRVREAARAGAGLVVFPETWLPGYPAWLDVCRDAALWDHPPVKKAFARMAAESVEVAGESGAALSQISAESGRHLGRGRGRARIRRSRPGHAV